MEGRKLGVLAYNAVRYGIWEAIERETEGERGKKEGIRYMKEGKYFIEGDGRDILYCKYYVILYCTVLY